MKTNLFIAGDWGTSSLRVYLCQYRDAGPSLVLDSLNGPGIGQMQGNFEEVFFGLISEWISQRGAMPIIISGMAGSTIGWKDAPYIECPADVRQIVQGRVKFKARGLEISIIAGLKTDNPLGAPDVMRGEELQLLGWMKAGSANASSDDGNAKLIALPGTHNKWVLIRQGRIETFLTALTGELFALLKNHSVLIADQNTGDFNEAAFIRGLEAIRGLGDAHLLHALFATRSRQVLGGLSPEQSQSYLSGLLIGSDTAGAIALFGKTAPTPTSVTLIGEPGLCERYRLALNHRGVDSITADAVQIATTGYETIYKHLYTNNAGQL